MQNGSVPASVDGSMDADNDPNESSEGVCPMALVEAFETLEAAERGLRAAKQARNQCYRRVQARRDILPVSRRAPRASSSTETSSVGSSTDLKDHGSSASSSTSTSSVEGHRPQQEPSLGVSCLPHRWRIHHRMKERFARLSRKSTASSATPPVPTDGSSKETSSALPEKPVYAVGSSASPEAVEEYQRRLEDVDAWRCKVIEAIRLVEELKGSVRRSILANMDPEEAARYTRLRQGLLAAAIVDLWVYDSERLRERFAVSVLDHPADVFSAVATDIDLLADVDDPEQARPLAVAYRTLAVLARLTLPSCARCEDLKRAATCPHAPQFIGPLVDSYESILEAFWEQRQLYDPLLERLKGQWDKLMRGSERYRDLIDLCQSEPVCQLGEDAKRRKFHSRVRKWRDAKTKVSEGEAPPSVTPTETSNFLRPPLAPTTRRTSVTGLPKRRPRSPSLLLHVSITPDGLEA